MEKAKEVFQYIVTRWGYKKPVIFGLLVLWAIRTFARNQGWLRKKPLRGQVVFISGAGSGIGRQLAFRMARLGCKVCVADINRQAAEDVAKSILAERKEAVAIGCDVSDKQSVVKAAADARQAFGDPQILINNAGIVSGAKLLDLDLANADRCITVNTTSHIYTTKEFLKDMLAKNHGHIVSIASMAGKAGMSTMTDYCASKFGAVGFNEALRLELKSLKTKVKTTCIMPFYINTGMFKGVTVNPLTMMSGMLDEGYVANRIIWAIQQDEEEVCLPWIQGIVTDVLKAFIPTGLRDQLAEALGLNSAMNTFKGRH